MDPSEPVNAEASAMCAPHAATAAKVFECANATCIIEAGSNPFARHIDCNGGATTACIIEAGRNPFARHHECMHCAYDRKLSADPHNKVVKQELTANKVADDR